MDSERPPGSLVDAAGTPQHHSIPAVSERTQTNSMNSIHVPSHRQQHDPDAPPNSPIGRRPSVDSDYGTLTPTTSPLTSPLSSVSSTNGSSSTSQHSGRSPVASPSGVGHNDPKNSTESRLESSPGTQKTPSEQSTLVGSGDETSADGSKCTSFNSVSSHNANTDDSAVHSESSSEHQPSTIHPPSTFQPVHSSEATEDRETTTDDAETTDAPKYVNVAETDVNNFPEHTDNVVEISDEDPEYTNSVVITETPEYTSVAHITVQECAETVAITNCPEASDGARTCYSQETEDSPERADTTELKHVSETDDVLETDNAPARTDTTKLEHALERTRITDTDDVHEKTDTQELESVPETGNAPGTDNAPETDDVLETDNVPAITDATELEYVLEGTRITETDDVQERTDTTELKCVPERTDTTELKYSPETNGIPNTENAPKTTLSDMNVMVNASSGNVHLESAEESGAQGNRANKASRKSNEGTAGNSEDSEHKLGKSLSKHRVSYLTRNEREKLRKQKEKDEYNKLRCHFHQFSMQDLILWFTNANDDGDTLLMNAIILEFKVLAKVLVRIVPSVELLDIRNKRGQTAMHLAVLTRQWKLTRKLVLAGADLQIRDWRGNTPLHVACERNDLDSVVSLTKCVTCLEVPEKEKRNKFVVPQPSELYNYDGFTCLHIATSRGFDSLVKYLVETRFRANVNVPERLAGKTPLHIAAELGNEELVEYFLGLKETDPDAVTYAGFSALDLARGSGQGKIARSLQRYGVQKAHADTDSEENEDDDNEHSGDEERLNSVDSQVSMMNDSITSANQLEYGDEERLTEADFQVSMMNESLTSANQLEYGDEERLTAADFQVSLMNESLTSTNQLDYDDLCVKGTLVSSFYG